MVMKGAFSEVRLTGDGRVEASGPMENDQGFDLKRLNFMLSQEGVMVEGEGEAAAGDITWHGKTKAGSLKKGEYVYAVGVAVLAHDAWPPKVQTFTWCEQVEVTGP